MKTRALETGALGTTVYGSAEKPTTVYGSAEKPTTVYGSAGKPTTVHGSAEKPIPPDEPPTRVPQDLVGQLFPRRAVGPGDVNPQLGAGVQDPATELDTPLGTGLYSRASEHNVDLSSLGLGPKAYAYEYGDDLSGGPVWMDGIPPLGTGRQDRAKYHPVGRNCGSAQKEVVGGRMKRRWAMPVTHRMHPQDRSVKERTEKVSAG
jgi:hypothetical protein